MSVWRKVSHIRKQMFDAEGNKIPSTQWKKYVYKRMKRIVIVEMNCGHTRTFPIVPSSAGNLYFHDQGYMVGSAISCSECTTSELPGPPVHPEPLEAESEVEVD